jgi:hypothetical protein
LRFLRLTTAFEADDRKIEAYKKNTAERLPAILKVCVWDSDVLQIEIAALLTALLPSYKIDAISEGHADLWAVLCRTPPNGDDDARFEIPSFVMSALRTPEAFSPKVLEERCEAMLSNYILGDELIRFLSANQAFVTKPEKYLPVVANPGSPYFVTGADFMRNLFQQSASVSCAQNGIDRIPVEGYSVPHAISICTEYYKAMTKLTSTMFSPHQYEMGALDQVRMVFVANPNFCNSSLLQEAVMEASDFLDVLRLLFESLAMLDHGFFLIWLIALKYYEAGSEAEQIRFEGTLNELAPKLPFRSREYALREILEKNFDAGFCLSLCESNDTEVIAHIEAAFLHPD